jgi:transposase-like protein
MKDYQTGMLDAAIPLPASVSVAMEDIAATMREGLLAMAVGAGLQVMQALMEESVTALCGPKGRHQPERSAVRHGSEDGSVSLGGRRVPVRRPRVRTADGSGEVPVPAYELFSSSEMLGEMAMARMLAGLSTRRYRVGLEPVGAEVEAAATATSKSAVSRRFVAATGRALEELLSRELSELDLVAVMLDGVHFAEHVLIVALGIAIDGTKIPLAVVEGSTENTTLVTDLLVGLRERGLDVCRPTLVVIDGSKALAAAVRSVFDRPILARCQLHKIRNVESKLPKSLAATVAKQMRAAYRMNNELAARAELENLARQLRKAHPGAAASPEEGARRHAHRDATRGATHPGTHAAVDQHDRVHDRDLPGALRQRQTLARRADGAALVRGGDGRGSQTVPPCQRASSPASTTKSTRRRSRRNERHTHRIRSRRGLNNHGTVTEVLREPGHPQHDRFSDPGVLGAAELIAFDVLDPDSSLPGPTPGIGSGSLCGRGVS